MKTLDIFNRIGNDPTYISYVESLVQKELTPEQISKELEIAGWFYAPYEEFALPYALPEMDLGSNDAIIVGTGAYNPLHEGHVSMFDKAKETLESLGYNVALGVVSLGHDSYIMRKTPNSPSVHARVRQCREFVKESDWLHVDIWESMGVSQDVNFTAVLDHVSRTYPTAKIFYIFGGDNSGFAKAFTAQNKYGTVCVSRPGYTIKDKCAGTIYVEGDSDMSSTKVRSLNGSSSETSVNSESAYMIRADARKALEWFPHVHSSNIKNAREIVRNAFSKVFTNIEYLDVEEQLHKMKKLQDKEGLVTVSADPWYEGSYQVRISRIFETYDLQHSISDYLIKDAPSIPLDSDLVFVDDDSSTGYTRNIVREIYGIEKFIALNELVTDSVKVDILDERDFLFGTQFGGLMVQRKQNTFRVPYLPPFVDLLNRVSIPDSEAQSFWESILEANRSLYANTGIRVEEIPSESHNWILDKGFELSSTMEEVVAYMISSAKSCTYRPISSYELIS